MSNVGYTPSDSAKLFAETWHMEILSRDIENKKQEIANLEQAKANCENMIAELLDKIGDGCKSIDDVINKIKEKGDDTVQQEK